MWVTEKTLDDKMSKCEVEKEQVCETDESKCDARVCRYFLYQFDILLRKAILSHYLTLPSGSALAPIVLCPPQRPSLGFQRAAATSVQKLEDEMPRVNWVRSSRAGRLQVYNSKDGQRSQPCVSCIFFDFPFDWL